jgi:diguanylate cyclase (GGDEF)-like protein
MTVFRALAVLLSILLSIILAGTFWVSISNSRRFLDAQLATHAQDTATYLGLTISSTVGHDEVQTAESIIDSVFDRGYYQQIRMVDMDGRPTIDRTMALVIKDVPAWFVKRIQLGAPSGSALIMSGWRQAGHIVVKTHPGHAYAELWRNFIGILGWSAGVYLVGMLALLALLRFVLGQLKTVEKMAEKISRREFPVLETLPWSRDLRRVVRAMNQMSRKLKASFEEQAAFIEALRDHAYRDPVTKIANRVAFVSRLQHLFQAPDEFSKGTLYILHIENFKTYNQCKGHAAGDRLLEQAARTIESECARTGREYVLARLTGAQFGIFIQSWQPAEVGPFADALIDSLDSLNRQPGDGAALVFHCGVAVFSGGETVSELFADADMALRAAKNRDGSNWQQHSETAGCRKSKVGADHLRRLLRNRLKAGDIALDLMPVFTIPEMAVLHHEVLVRVADDHGTFIPAQFFIHLAEQMACVSDLDRLVIASVLERIEKSSGSSHRYAINLSTGSLKDQPFVTWLCDLLKTVPEHARRLAFECRESDLVADLEAVASAADRITAAGGDFGVDRFGSGSPSFGYLLHLKPVYLKLDGRYLIDIGDNTENQFFIRSTATMAHGLGIELIATHVHKKSDADLLNHLGVDAIQGSGLDAPDYF